MISRRLTVVCSFFLCIVLLAGSGVSALQKSASVRTADKAGLDATEEVLKRVSLLRGLDVKSPIHSSARTKDEIEKFIIRDLDESTTPAEFAATTKFMIKLGLVSSDFALREYMIKLLREQVAGFYDPKTKEFYLAAWLPISEQKKVIAHELVHALQDQHFNLRRFDKWPKGDSDAELAVHALIEGDATMLMIQYDLQEQGIKLDVINATSLTDTMLSENTEDDSKLYPVLAAAPRVLRETLQFPYVYGAGFVQALCRARAHEGLNRSFSNLPESTEQIMHPDHFLLHDEPIKVEIPELGAALGADWKCIDQDVNGEFGYLVLLSQFVPKGLARTAAEGWGGDRYLLYENAKTGALLVAQFTTWDTEADAREFFDAYSRRMEARYKLSGAEPETKPPLYKTNEGLASLELRGKDVAVIEGASSASELQSLFVALWQSKKMKRH